MSVRRRWRIGFVRRGLGSAAYRAIVLPRVRPAARPMGADEAALAGAGPAEPLGREQVVPLHLGGGTGGAPETVDELCAFNGPALPPHAGCGRVLSEQRIVSYPWNG
jgi:hypothetical protein